MTVAAPVTFVQELTPLIIGEDIARSVDSYREKPGWQMTMKWEPGGNLQWCRLERDAAALMLQ